MKLYDFISRFPNEDACKEHFLVVRKKNGVKCPKCLSCGKSKKATDFVGGHIFEVTDSDKMYICPVCESCNSTYGEGKEPSPEFIVTVDDCVDFTLEDAVERPEKS